MGTVTNPSPEPHPETAATLVFDDKSTAHSIPEDVLGLLTGTFVASLGLYLLQSSGAVTGGTAGIALLIDYATEWPFWLIFAVVNLPFAALAIWKKGWSFTLRTAVSIALVSAFSVLHHALFRIDELQPIYGTVAGNLLAGVGLLILFRHRASLGGVNIIALVVQERTGFRAGWTQLTVDLVIIVAALFVLPWPAVLLSAAGAVLLNVVLALNHRPGRYIGH
ncbi:YitT family protein [Microbacterium sp. cx-59]|uniref:YitT family protein n=1 Tax=Microbacterium sp. cx-59 TaxID=2891207 RepID=UPI001E41F5C7|nr:YitT family protein [Microbacterium sp. cx-59]MCC4908275.1 YitT family protein [Microbacterium sp. cx-59]